MAIGPDIQGYFEMLLILSSEHKIWEHEAALDSLGAMLTIAVHAAARAKNEELLWLLARAKNRVNKYRGRLRRLAAECRQRGL